jgi:hypothetical protein
MANELEPIEGRWYETADGTIFRIVAIDSDFAMIELQYENGDIDEMARNDWHNLPLEQVVMPSDWRGSMDPGTDEET